MPILTINCLYYRKLFKEQGIFHPLFPFQLFVNILFEKLAQKIELLIIQIYLSFILKK